MFRLIDFFDFNKLIKHILGKLKKEGLIIHNAWVDQNDNTLLLVSYSDKINSSKIEDFFWVSAKQISSSKINEYTNQLKELEISNNNLFNKNDPDCNSSKLFTLPCEQKCRTVGIFLGVYNCGIIGSYKVIIHNFYHISCN